jgi:hypothetical protein
LSKKDQAKTTTRHAMTTTTYLSRRQVYERINEKFDVHVSLTMLGNHAYMGTGPAYTLNKRRTQYRWRDVLIWLRRRYPDLSSRRRKAER